MYAIALCKTYKWRPFTAAIWAILNFGCQPCLLINSVLLLQAVWTVLATPAAAIVLKAAKATTTL